MRKRPHMRLDQCSHDIVNSEALSTVPAFMQSRPDEGWKETVHPQQACAGCAGANLHE